MTPEEFTERISVLAKVGITVEEASAGMNKVGKVLYEIMVEEIKAMAKRRGISFEEAEKIYLGRMDAVSGKHGKFSQCKELRKVRKHGGYDY